MKINILKIKLRISKISSFIDDCLKNKYLNQTMKFFSCYHKGNFFFDLINISYLHIKSDIYLSQIFMKGLQTEIIRNDKFSHKQYFYKNLLCRIENFYFSVKKQHFYTIIKGNKEFLLEIHSNIGGSDSDDWTNMLMNMYKKWFIRKKIVFYIVNYNTSSSGIKSIIFRIKSSFAYILLRREVGLHKLIRISPFDNKNKRHTTFSEVSIHPIKYIFKSINHSDLIINTYKSSGSGGQHINTTDSAVRIKHVPSNIVVTCQEQRSQHRNKKICINILKEKLHIFEKKKQKIITNSKILIRSYILHPYQMVKDYTSFMSTTNVISVLQGNIDPFIYN